MRLSRQKDKGTRFETDTVRYLRGELADERPERTALHGSHDCGDIGHIYAHGFRGIAECKCHERVTASLVERWRAQTVDERDNADADFGLLIVSVRNHGVGESVVHVTLRDLARVALPVELGNGTDGNADDAWVTMTLAECCRLMKADS